ncbi:hypothetical protein TH5_04380 [Thalassospira xianhensis MCCC 1A02616]|uniref:Uncharacterized protein n=1 Tax=Thalassospira xianhensis MCCC 1A02616 TaxID=1177929 RepID=A0A367UG42_9PROT|nr:hypothetical protein TH5_04380 [Thalassospira xianhensis MCCC 1A02616]
MIHPLNRVGIQSPALLSRNFDTAGLNVFRIDHLTSKVNLNKGRVNKYEVRVNQIRGWSQQIRGVSQPKQGGESTKAYFDRSQILTGHTEIKTTRVSDEILHIRLRRHPGFWNW